MIVGAAPSGDGIYTIHEYGIAATQSGNSNATGHTSVSSALVGGQKTLIFPVFGQSLAACSLGSTNYTPSNALVHNMSLYDGNVYQFKEQALGCSGTLYSFMGRLGDNLITAGDCARVIFCPGAIGGSSSFDWSQGPLYSRLLVMARRFRALGWTPTAVLWEQGQADVSAGTTSAQYQANVILAQSIFKDQGFDVPWLIAQCTMLAGSTNATIQGAQAALVNPAAKRYAGPNVDLISSSNRYDGTHPNDTGAAQLAGTGSQGWQTAIENMHF